MEDELLPIERRVNDVITQFPRPVRLALLDVLSNRDPSARSRVIGSVYDSTQLRPLANLLIDLEAEPPARAFVVEMLSEYEQRPDA